MMGPMVASISAFINPTSFLCRNASKATRAPNSTEPVTSTMTSTSGERANRNASSVITDDAFLLARSPEVDVIVDVTGSVEFGARVAFEAFRHKKDVGLMNAEIDATIGPIIQ